MIDVPLHSDKNTNQFHIHDLYILFCSKGPNYLYVIFRRIQSEWFLIFTCYDFWYSMYFQF
jgi:hypothetical protein